MAASTRFRTTAAIAGLLALAGCTQRRTACGDPAPQGGPPVISSREGELCESVRLRVADALAGLKDLEPEYAEQWRDLTWRWEDVRTVEGLLRRVQDETKPEVADAMRRAVEEVRAHSSKPFRPDCADQERCLVRGAALGARISFDNAASILRTLRRAAARANPAGNLPE